MYSIKRVLMELVKVKRHYQITLPQAVRKKFNISEGDFIEVEGKDDEIVFRPVTVVHTGQEYFHSKEWQKGEAEADKDVAEGNMVGPFDNIEDSLQALKKSKA
jgi:AbrB family looped-hinge helix DNA binding protein